MLQSLFPKAHQKFRALPLPGSVVDGFDDWLSANRYTPKSRKFSIRFLIDVDADLRKRGVGEVAELSRPVLYESWRDLIKVWPNHAGTVRTMARYLNAVGSIETGAIQDAPTVSPESALSDEYSRYLQEVRGCAASTVSHHRFASRCFLDHLDASQVALDSLQARDIEAYITQASKRMCRASLQHEIAAVRGLLRFLSTDGRVRTGLDRQIDTPRLYRLEQLPRALPWETVTTLLKSIDTKSAMGLRDYAMFLLIAHLRASRQRGRCHRPGRHPLAAWQPANQPTKDLIAIGASVDERSVGGSREALAADPANASVSESLPSNARPNRIAEAHGDHGGLPSAGSKERA